MEVRGTGGKWEFDKAAERGWFDAFKNFCVPTLESATILLEGNGLPDSQLIHARMALQFVRYALFHIEKANELGHHAIALSLLRQASDPLFLDECALIGDSEGKKALECWATDQKMTMGKLRKNHSQQVWNNDGGSFLGHTWSKFLEEFYASIQEYAHFNPTTLQWTLSPFQSERANGGRIVVSSHEWVYNAEQATRITLFQSILVYFLARAIKTGSRILSKKANFAERELKTYEHGLRQSRLIRLPFSWKRELLGMSFHAPKMH